MCNLRLSFFNLSLLVIEFSRKFHIEPNSLFSMTVIGILCLDCHNSLPLLIKCERRIIIYL